MPLRLIREGILDSEPVNSLSEGAELFYRKLMSIVDDHGLFEARIEVLRVRLFGLRLNDWPAERVESCLRECNEARNADGDPLVLLYEVGAKQYLQIRNFGQQTRSKPKFPTPPGYDWDPQTKQVSDCVQLKAPASNGKQKATASNGKQVKALAGPIRARAGVPESESEAKAYSEPEAQAKAAGDARATAAAPPGSPACLPAQNPAAAAGHVDLVLGAIKRVSGARPKPDDLPPDLVLLIARHGSRPVVDWIEQRGRRGVKSAGLFLEPGVVSEIRQHVEARARPAPQQRQPEDPEHYPPADIEAALAMPGGAEAFGGYCRECGWIEAKCECGEARKSA